MTESNSTLDFPQVLKKSFDVSNECLKVSQVAGILVPENYDSITLTYITSGNGTGEIGTVVYKLDGTTVATLSLTYDASDRLSTVTKS